MVICLRAGRTAPLLGQCGFISKRRASVPVATFGPSILQAVPNTPTWPRCSSSQKSSVSDGGGDVDAAFADGGSVASSASAPQPLAFDEQLCIYRSSASLSTVAEKALSKCRVGTSLGLSGFAGVLFGVPTAPPVAAGVIAVAAAINTYKHLYATRCTMQEIATRHVESVVILPNTSGESPGSCQNPAASIEPSSSSTEERLKATQEVDLLVRTTNLEFRMRLVDPAAAWEGAKYSGFVDDDRPSFSSLYQRGDVLHFDDLSAWGRPGAPSSDDQALLEALVASSKVVDEHSISKRDDVASLLHLSSGADGSQIQLKQNKSSSSASKGTQEQKLPPPAEEIERVGKQSLLSNGVIFVAGSLFVGKRLSEKPDGEGGGIIANDPKLSDLFARFTKK
eukprot:TRINITY_DN63196_c0_g1_i1.p1 TRINITY_DN63196_c0_g1~~TRINITY_DN63196_c0_g1_i1.p1  ORF type:complete len:413 (+),score=75.55 TRINITY_DN63196_c0_g1_i1:57-1241(+)